MISYYQYIYPVFMASIDGLALSLLKLKHTGVIKNAWVLPFTMLMYSTQPLIFYKALSLENMTVLNLLWDVISDIIVTFIGIFIFNETITIYQAFGVVFSFIGITLLGIK